MGYRSDVALELSRNVVIPNYIKIMLAAWCDEFEVSPDGDIVCEISAIKWYTGTDCIDRFEQWLDNLDPEEFRFIRIGEENDDIEDRGRSEIFNCHVSVSFNRLNVDDGASINCEDVDLKTMVDTVFSALEPELNLKESKEAIVYRIKLIKRLSDYYINNNTLEYEDLIKAVETMNNDQLRAEIERCLLV